MIDRPPGPGRRHLQCASAIVGIDILDRLADAFAQKDLGVAVAQFPGLVGPRAGSAGHGGSPERAVGQHHIDFDGGVAAAVKNLPTLDIHNRAHERSRGLTKGKATRRVERPVRTAGPGGGRSSCHTSECVRETDKSGTGSGPPQRPQGGDPTTGCRIVPDSPCDFQVTSPSHVAESLLRFPQLRLRAVFGYLEGGT